MHAILIFLLLTTGLHAAEPAQYYKGRADYHLHRGEISKAILDYQRALRITPNFPECHYQLGRIYMKTGQFTFAIRSFHRVIALRGVLVEKSMLLETYLALAKAHHRLGRIKNAIHNKDDVIMMDYVNKIIASFKPGGIFNPVKKSKRAPLYKVNRFYYLAKAFFIRGRFSRDHRQKEQYYKDYQACLKYLKYDLENYFPKTVMETKRGDFVQQLLRLKQTKPGQWGRARPLILNISICFYYLWENNYHRGNYATARNYKNWALRLNPSVFNMQLDRPYFDVFKTRKSR